jgi:hypothetical protein
MRTLLAGVILVGAVDVVHADGALDRASISAGIAKVKARVQACASQATTGGTVKVVVKVAPDGSVTSATPNASDVALGTCVADVVKSATFAASTQGGSFSYPFVFDAPAGKTVAANKPAAPAAAGGKPSSAGPPSTPELDRVAISTGMDSIKPQVEQCRAKHKINAKLKMRVTVAAAGHVTSVEPEGGTKAAGKCIADAIMSINFGATASGGSFSYPFVFGAPPAASTNTPATAQGAAQLPDALDRAAIQTGIASIDAKVNACRTKHARISGLVRLEITVAGNGRVTNVAHKAGDKAQAACLTAAVKSIAFARTVNGGQFTYPFTFGL